MVNGEVGVFDEWNRLVRGFSRKDVAKGDIFEAKVLANVVVVRDIYSSGDAVKSQLSMLMLA